jgi:hypothetical protein
MEKLRQISKFALYVIVVIPYYGYHTFDRLIFNPSTILHVLCADADPHTDWNVAKVTPSFKMAAAVVITLSFKIRCDPSRPCDPLRHETLDLSSGGDFIS